MDKKKANRKPQTPLIYNLYSQPHSSEISIQSIQLYLGKQLKYIGMVQSAMYQAKEIPKKLKTGKLPSQNRLSIPQQNSQKASINA